MLSFFCITLGLRCPITSGVMAARITSEWVITKYHFNNAKHNKIKKTLFEWLIIHLSSPTYTPLCTHTDVLLLQVSGTMLRRRKWVTTTPQQYTGSQKWTVVHIKLHIRTLKLIVYPLYWYQVQDEVSSLRQLHRNANWSCNMRLRDCKWGSKEGGTLGHGWKWANPHHR